MRNTSWGCGILVVALVTACGSDPPAQGGDAPPPVDAEADAPVDAPRDGRGSDVDASDATVPFTCVPDQFVACDSGNAHVCNEAGDGVVVESCGMAGCNALAGRCNECVPGAATCDGDVLHACGLDGRVAPDERCQRSCVSGPVAHCERLVPVYLPAACTTAAPLPALTVSTAVTLDTGIDTNCTGGIATQVGGPDICVVRHASITVADGGTLTLVGPRAAALVSDDALDVLGTIDAAAEGRVSGPGGGLVPSGAPASFLVGAGGAGGRTSGGAGGTSSATGGGNNAGARFDPLIDAILTGGRRAAQPQVGIGVHGGGGGGALILASCRGTVSIAGTVDAGGGGGEGGFDVDPGPATQLLAGGGGGSGGYVVVQGLSVKVSGRVFASGGGGGSGGAGNTVGRSGGDGARSASSCAAGGEHDHGGTGGAGGCGETEPGGGGASTFSPGGGGGAVGRFQAYVPTGGSLTLTPLAASPPFESSLSVATE